MSRRPQSYGSMSSTPDVLIAGELSADFNNICDNVVTNIHTIKSGWKTLETALKSIGTPRDNQGLRDKIHVTQLSNNQIITVTTKDMQKLTALVRKGDKQQKLQADKLMETFKEVVAKYSLIQKQVADKMKANFLQVTIENEMEEPGLQQQLQISSELRFEQDMLVEREARVRQIEADVLDVNEIMRELGSLVHQQTETIDTIENTIDHATGNVEEGTSELIKASQYQSRYRRKLCILVIVAAVVIAVLIGVLVTELKH